MPSCDYCENEEDDLTTSVVYKIGALLVLNAGGCWFIFFTSQWRSVLDFFLVTR